MFCLNFKRKEENEHIREVKLEIEVVTDHSNIQHNT